MFANHTFSIPLSHLFLFRLLYAYVILFGNLTLELTELLQGSVLDCELHSRRSRWRAFSTCDVKLGSSDFEPKKGCCRCVHYDNDAVCA